MASALGSYLNKKIVCLLTDGRTVTGKLVSVDQITNLALQNCVERVIRREDDEEMSSEEDRGLFLVRGEMVVLCGLVDEELDARIDWTKVRGKEIRSTKHI